MEKGPEMDFEQGGLYLALVHFPVLNKNGETIASAVTNLDIHDMARSCLTFGAKKLYVVTPLEDQKTLVERILGHWVSGRGAEHNADRKEALSIVEIAHDMEEVISRTREAEKHKPLLVSTTARPYEKALSHDDLKNLLALGQACILVFGTAWGLSDDLLLQSDYVLEPIQGNTLYNHLSVRSAAAILLDRITGSS